HIAGDRKGHRGDDLEACERPARALPPALERWQRDLANVGGRAEPEDRAVGDLASQLQHLAGQRGEVDTRRRRPLGERETPSNAEVSALEVGASAQGSGRRRAAAPSQPRLSEDPLQLARPLSRGSTTPPAESGARRGGAPSAGPRWSRARGSAPGATGPQPPPGGRAVGA